jgi:hypothetical protein
MEALMQTELPILFERNLYRAVIRFKQEHPGALEARTKAREEKERREENAGN